jgi:hypothetical protein
MFLRKIDIALAFTSPALLAVIALVLLRRKLYSEYRFFFAYACGLILIPIGLVATAKFAGQPSYLRAFSIAAFCNNTMSLLAMNESFHKVFSVYSIGRNWLRYLLPCVILLVLSISTWRWIETSHEGRDSWAVFFAFNLSSDYMMAAVFATFGLLVFFWQPGWQQYPFGIMKGFGLFSIVGMLADLLRSDFGTKMNLFFSYAPAVAYIVACLIWLGAFLRPEPEEQAPRPGSLVNVEELVALLERLIKAVR